MENFFIRAERVFTPIRKYAFIYTLLVAFAGLWFPRLGLTVLLVILSLVVLSFFKGRYWCGNFCAHGSLFDSALFRWSRNIKIPEFFKSPIFAWLFLAYFSYNIGTGLIRVSALWGTPMFFDRLGFIFVRSYLMVTIVGGTLALITSPRTWCNFCPMGMMQKGSYWLGKTLGVAKKFDQKITVANQDMCHTCGKCSRVCPMQLTPYVDFSDENQIDDSNCIRCSTCVENCPAGVLTLSTAAEAKEIHDKTSVEGYEERKHIITTISAIKELNTDVKEFTFSFKIPEIVSYQPGQFILVRIQEHPEMYRAFSISSYNKNSQSLSVTVKRVPKGYGSDILFDTFKEGDVIHLEGPMGHELVVDKSQEKVLLVAGGIGITPFVPIVEDLINDPQNVKNITLIYGVNKEEEFIYRDLFEKFEHKSSKFTFTPVVAFDDQWKGEKGFVTDVLSQMNLNDSKLYMCGPKPMTDATLRSLEKSDYHRENIYYESA